MGSPLVLTYQGVEQRVSVIDISYLSVFELLSTLVVLLAVLSALPQAENTLMIRMREIIIAKNFFIIIYLSIILIV